MQVVNSYKISLNEAQAYEGNDEVLQVDATVENANPCSQLSIHLYFSNTDEGRSVARVVGEVQNYNMDIASSFSAPDILDGIKHRNADDWIVEEIKVTCVQ